MNVPPSSTIVPRANRGVGTDRTRISPTIRLLLAGAGVVLVGLLATARSLTPDARDFGTHEQLGLTPCNFYRWTGWQCPTCGATTAWSHAMRGDWSAAARANLAAAIVCPFAVTVALWCLASAIVGRFLLVSPTTRVWLAIGSVLVAVALLDWIRRVLISP